MIRLKDTPDTVGEFFYWSQMQPSNILTMIQVQKEN